MAANEESDWQIEKNKQKMITTKHGHRCSRLATGKVRFLGHKFNSISNVIIQNPTWYNSDALQTTREAHWESGRCALCIYLFSVKLYWRKLICGQSLAPS